MFKGFFLDFLEEGKNILIRSILDLLPDKVSFKGNLLIMLPDVVGYTAILCGGLMMLCPMVNVKMTKPIGLFAVVGIISISILGAI